MSSTDEPLLEVEDLSVAFESEKTLSDYINRTDPDEVRAVDGVDLEIGKNDVIALVGESGCGKTTLGKTLIGLQEPSEGSVKFRGQDIMDAKRGRNDPDISWPEIRRSLQIIHQDPGGAINPNKRVIHTLSKPLKRWQPELSVTEREERIYKMLERVGMSPPEDYAGRYPHQLSGGEKQRVALVRALLMNPDLILADEAISALDVSLRVEMMDLFLELQDTFDTSFVFISHDLSNARYLAEKAGGRIGVMYLGEFAEIGTVDQIIDDPRHPYTKVLRWATPNLRTHAAGAESPPVRKIDIPDPVDPPSGCRFHTRCPEAREACMQENPEPLRTADGREIACFREYDDHEYWNSEELVDESPTNVT